MQEGTKVFNMLEDITENDKIKCIADNAWEKLKEVAKDWTNIKIDSNDELFHFTEVTVEFGMKYNRLVEYMRIAVSNSKRGLIVIEKIRRCIVFKWR